MVLNALLATVWLERIKCIKATNTGAFLREPGRACVRYVYPRKKLKSPAIHRTF